LFFNFLFTLLEFCERLAYYGFAGSLVLFFQTKLDMSNEDAVNQFYAWNGFVYVTPLIGGYIADTLLGRYKTILYFSMLYLIGLALFVFGSVPGAIVQGVIFTAMYTVALGAGGIKPNVSTMGADQFDPKIPQDKKESEQFFSYFYWSINLGALIAYSLVAYVCQYGLPGLGGEPWGFFVGYLIPTIMMCFGVLVFMSGSSNYKKVSPRGSMLTTAGGILYEALVIRYNDTSPTGYLLDKASDQHGGSYAANDVEGVKYVAKLTPFLGVMIPYWGIYGQTKTAFQIQGCQMQSTIGTFQLPISAMNMFNNVAILILVPLTDQVLYPKLKEKGYGLTMLNKIGWGFVFAVLAMVVAGLIELYRIQQAPSAGNYYDTSARDNISPCRNIDNYDPYKYQDWYADHSLDKPLNCQQICPAIDGVLSLSCISCDDIPQMSQISIFWQVPQFVLIGISEIFASITSLEFFYSQAPSRMRSVSQASNLFTNALGSWLTIPLTLLVNINPRHQWVTSNVDEGNLQAYFYLLAGLMSGALILFYYLSAGYVYADPLQLAALDHLGSMEIQATLLPTDESRVKDFDELES
jgi:solute carrier family 15 (peptide/histidine transporter), member 3/4